MLPGRHKSGDSLPFLGSCLSCKRQLQARDKFKQETNAYSGNEIESLFIKHTSKKATSSHLANLSAPHVEEVKLLVSLLVSVFYALEPSLQVDT